MNINLVLFWVLLKIGPAHLISLSPVLLTPVGPNQ